MQVPTCAKSYKFYSRDWASYASKYLKAQVGNWEVICFALIDAQNYPGEVLSKRQLSLEVNVNREELFSPSIPINVK